MPTRTLTSTENLLVKDIDEYGDFTVRMWMGDPAGEIDERQLAIMSLGLPGEVGEVIEILKKRLRDGTFDRENLIKELGDVAYYWARLCRAFDVTPSEVLALNIEKLESRRARGTMHGSGDDR
jgi:NTP pyrophosphatase (non-canonical NTP hydrolase)